MGAQSYLGSYLAAFEQANDHLEEIFQEYEQLQYHKERLENVAQALQPFLASVEDYQQEAIQPAAFTEPSYAAEPALPIGGPIFNTEFPKEPVVAAVGSDDVLDPIQYRINRALGLAVA